MRYRVNILSLLLLIVLLLLQDGNTPLVKAARGGHTNTVKELLSSGATVDLAGQVSAWKCIPFPCSAAYDPCVLYLYQLQSEN